MTDTTEAKIRRLLDLEAIRALKYRYAGLCDAGYPADELAALFTADAVWQGDPLGRYEGRAAIRAFFAATPEMLRFAVHYLTNPLIEVNGDVATGSWCLWQPLVVRQADQAYWLMASYADRYRREADGWKFADMKLLVKSLTPYELGPGRVLMSDDFG